MPFIDHPMRERVVSEMHMRRMPPLHAPTVMIQTVRLVDPDERAAERAHILQMPGVPTDAMEVRASHVGGRSNDGSDYIWERHSEASTTTLIMPANPARPFDAIVDDHAAVDWLLSAPGRVLRAVRIAIVADDGADSAFAAACFSPDDLVSGTIGSIRFWSDFLVRDDKFGRLVVAAGDVPPPDLGRKVQQLQELGNYRNLALLGLPVAQAEGPQVADLEQALVDIAERMAAGEADTALLDRLCQLAARVTAITATSAFRLSATSAYTRIVEDRLDGLRADAVSGFQSLEEFTERRLLPATRTCTSFSARLESLSVRIERATSLLRTRVEMVLQAQNADLLRSVDRNAERQLRLQRVVEGLSVVAVSYYAVSLLAYVLHAVADRYRLPDEQLIAWSVGPVIAMVWVLLRRKVRAIVDAGR